MSHTKCVFCGSTSCTCFDTDEEYDTALAESKKWEEEHYQCKCPLCPVHNPKGVTSEGQG